MVLVAQHARPTISQTTCLTVFEGHALCCGPPKTVGVAIYTISIQTSMAVWHTLLIAKKGCV